MFTHSGEDNDMKDQECNKLTTCDDCISGRTDKVSMTCARSDADSRAFCVPNKDSGC